jgi:hypothetical protein
MSQIVGSSTDLEGAHECLIYAHHGSGILKLPAIVRSRENCDKLTLGKELIPLLHNLLRAWCRVETRERHIANTSSTRRNHTQRVSETNRHIRRQSCPFPPTVQTFII